MQTNGKTAKRENSDRFIGTKVLNHDLTGGGGGMMKFRRISFS